MGHFCNIIEAHGFLLFIDIFKFRLLHYLQKERMPTISNIKYGNIGQVFKKVFEIMFETSKESSHWRRN